MSTTLSSVRMSSVTDGLGGGRGHVCGRDLELTSERGGGRGRAGRGGGGRVRAAAERAQRAGAASVNAALVRDGPHPRALYRHNARGKTPVPRHGPQRYVSSTNTNNLFFN